MVILLILMIGTVTGYDLKCPAKSEWRLRANTSCSSEDRYVCLFHVLENKYEENCLGLDKSDKGSKLVFQPLFNLAECDTDRYQPIVFTTHRNSDCLFFKSNCSEEGQVVYSNGSSSIDTVCHCDYTKGYAFVSKPKSSCFCLPSVEDCSCFRVNCSKLSSDYQCLNDGGKNITTVTCQEIYPQMTYKRHKQTVANNKRNIKRYSSAGFVGFTMLTLLPVSIIIVVFVFVYKDIKQRQRARDDERKEQILKGERGKHHFARLVIIGKKGVGKTSLMRRLLGQNKKEVMSTTSTDGIEIEKCNINVTNGKWSQCDKIDNDLARLIHRSLTEKKHYTAKASRQNVPLTDSVQAHSNYDTLSQKSSGILVIDDNTGIETSTNKTKVKTSSQTCSKEGNDIEFENDENTEIIYNRLESQDTSAINTNLGNINARKHEVRGNVEYFDDNRKQINESEHENELRTEKDENINRMTSSIMKSCLHRRGDEQDDPLAFCWLWDFAGEKDYYATHQVFLSTCAVYLLVTDSLEFSTAKMLWTDIEDSAEYVNFWFDAIHCYWSCTKANRLDPPIIVVCTNQDQFKDFSERQKRQKQFKENLGQALNKQKKKNHLRNIYFVSNTEDADNVFEEIRRCISNQAMDMKDWGKECPLQWLLFQQVLEKLKDSNLYISTTKKLIEIAKHEEIGIDQDEEVKRCLQYCHDIGTVIYFDEEYLEEYVILDPKWLVDAFRCLVSDKIGDIILASDDWQKLKETGELTEMLISRLFMKEPKLMFSENKSHLIEVMKRFDVIVHLRNSHALYMPCMMKSCTFREFKEDFIYRRQHFTRTSWFCLEFEFLPPAFFNHILAWYIKQYSVSALLDRGTRSEMKALYRQIGVFDLDVSGCEQLVVCEGPNVIALQVWNAQMSDTTYGGLKSSLIRFVDTLRNRYKLRIKFTKSFKCKNGDFTFQRKTMNDLLMTEYYFCQEHNKNHSAGDLVTPWDLNEELQMMYESEIELTIEDPFRKYRGMSQEEYDEELKKELDPDEMKKEMKTQLLEFRNNPVEMMGNLSRILKIYRKPITKDEMSPPELD